MFRSSRLHFVLCSIAFAALVLSLGTRHANAEADKRIGDSHPLIRFSNPLADPPTSGFLATYYSGRNLEGAPIFTRTEPVINWSYDEGGSPVPGSIPSTDFSARWEGWYTMDRPGAWTFTYTSDDGGRLWIDNELVIDMWYAHSPLTRAVTRQFSAGYHLIRVEYYQSTGGMTSQLIITPPGEFPDWMGEYFDNPFVVGEPRLTQSDPEINFNWGTASPDARIPSDNFSARWTRLYNFAPGSYTFSATADDGIRVWVGDTLAIDAWIPQSPKTYTSTLYLNGLVPLRVEYFEQGGDAIVNFTFAPAPQNAPAPASEAWTGTLFNNATLAPPAVCELPTPQIAFNWNGNSPGCGVSAQTFSASWTSARNTPATGFYTVYLTVDDGARVYVDDAKILDAWQEQSPTDYSTTVYLDAGLHNWRVEYFQASGGAQINLQIIAGVAAAVQPAPVTDSGDITVDVAGSGWTQGGNAASWRTSPNGRGGSALWTYNDAFVLPTSAWGRWYPSLPHSRNYEVSVYVPANLATTNNARYWIFHAGKFDSVARAQAPHKNQWVSLGIFDFTGQGGEFVLLSDVTYECYLCTTVVWDAVKFSPR